MLITINKNLMQKLKDYQNRVENFKDKKSNNNKKNILDMLDYIFQDILFTWKIELDLKNDFDAFIYYNVLELEKRPPDILPF